MLQPDIESFLSRGGLMRVVTTAYMGATDPKALEELAAISTANGSRLQIRFSRESDATRLHAKAYIHRRESGFGSAYIGSANLSRPALTEGLEWTVRLSQAASPGLWSKIEETFEQWWGDPDFLEYGLTPDHPTHAQFRELIAREKGAGAQGSGEQLSSLPIFDLQPKPFQQAILDRISVERQELAVRGISS
ncbi:MAG: phospholipase D-like domain-containing protein [Phycisphaerales bacterium]